MLTDSIALVAFVVGTAGNSVKAIPQFVRTAVQGRVAGLSPGAVWLAFTASVLWLCFGLSIGDRWVIALMSVQAFLTAGTAVRFTTLTRGATRRRPPALALIACSAFVVMTVVGAPAVLEVLGASLGVVIGAPQLLYLWRRRSSPVDVSGVSRGEYVIVIAAQAGWTTYWLLQGHPIAAAGALWGGFARASTLVLMRQQNVRRRSLPTASTTD